MTTIIPSPSSCHVLQLPPTEKDDRLNLNVRTGSASVLLSSLVFAYGGLTIGLDLGTNVSPQEITSNFIKMLEANKSKKIKNYLSGEMFYLDLISKVWTRVNIPEGSPKPKPRLFHELCRGVNCVYLFGGITLPDDLDDRVDEKSCQLVPCNDLWEFNLKDQTWKLLHDGSPLDDPKNAPSPRYCHKMTLIQNLQFAKKKDHYGLLIAGGRNAHGKPLYDNFIFDLVDKTYIETVNPIKLVASSGNPTKDSESGLTNFSSANHSKELNVNYLDSAIVNFSEEVEYHHHHHHHDRKDSSTHGPVVQNISTLEEESIVVYSPTKEGNNGEIINPMLSFRVGKKLGTGKTMPLHKRKGHANKLKDNTNSQLVLRTIPYNLRYPTGGLFGQNIVIIGFLPGDFDISIFIYNRPTGKWSRLNIFCHHDYGSHRFWGGFAWTSHHKVVLLGNYVTSRTTSSVRFFSSMITVSLPVTNILASFEMTGSHFHGPDGKRYVTNENSSTDEAASNSTVEDESASSMSDSDVEDHIPARHTRKLSSVSSKSSSKPGAPNLSFNEYVHYAAPKASFTKIRSVFPPAAITLGRSAFDRYGDMMSDLEFVSSNGDRIPVSMTVLKERWGKYFIDILAKAYVSAVDKFENDAMIDPSPNKPASGQMHSTHKKKRNSAGDVSGDQFFDPHDKTQHFKISTDSPPKEAPKFRLPFQDISSAPSLVAKELNTSVDPHKIVAERNASISSSSSTASAQNTHPQDLPPQLPIPEEPLPSVPLTPSSFRTSSRKNSADPNSPRASLMHTLTVLRSIPAQSGKSPRTSPFTSPRSSISGDTDATGKVMPLIKADKNITDEPSEQTNERRPSARRSVSSTSDNPYKKSSLGTLISDTSTPSDKSESLQDNSYHEEDSHERTILNFENTDAKSFEMEPSLIPRKLYIPFCTSSLKAFAEYLYTGQVGNRWPLRPCALDCMLIGRYFRVPLLYDLTSEVLFGIIGRKEVHIIKESRKMKRKFAALSEELGHPLSDDFKFPLDEFEGFMNTVDDGYLDIALLRKSSSVHKGSVSSQGSWAKSSSLSSSIPEEPTQFNKSDYFQSSKKATNEEANSPKSGLFPNSEVRRNSNDASLLTEGEIELHYLDFQEKNTILGPRSKSVFDRPTFEVPPSYQEDTADEKERILSTTLEGLVSPESPPPHDYVIEIIYEISTMCSDLKLMLRSLNVTHMSRALKEFEEDIRKLERRAELRRDSTGHDETQLQHTMTEENYRSARPSVATIENTGSGPSVSMRKSQTLEGGEGGGLPISKPALHPMRSSTSVNTVLSKFRFTPLRSQSSTSRSNSKGQLEDPKNIDKKIQQIIRHEEKKKNKEAKEEKLRVAKEKKLGPSSENLSRTQSEANSFDQKGDDGETSSIFSLRSLASKKSKGVKSGFMNRLGRAMKHIEPRKAKEVADDQQSVTTQRSSPSVSSNSSKKPLFKGVLGRNKK